MPALPYWQLSARSVSLKSVSDGQQWQLTELNTDYQRHRWQIRGQYQRGDSHTDLGRSSFDGELRVQRWERCYRTMKLAAA